MFSLQRGVFLGVEEDVLGGAGKGVFLLVGRWGGASLAVVLLLVLLDLLLYTVIGLENLLLVLGSLDSCGQGVFTLKWHVL